MNYNRNLKHIMKHVFAMLDYNRFYNIIRKNRADEFEECLINKLQFSDINTNLILTTLT